jgi:hypothetical protein
MLNLNRLLQFGTKKPIAPGAKVVYFADSFDAMSNFN